MQKIFLITLITMFFCGMYIPVVYVPVYTVVIGVTLILFCLGDIKRIQSISKFCKYRFFRVLIFYILWVCLSGLFLVFFGNYDFYYYLYCVYLLFLYGNFSWYIFPYLICPSYFSLKSIARFLVIAIYFICLYGIIEYLFKAFNLPIFDFIQNIILNRRLYEFEGFNNFQLKRLVSIFEEPGYLGGFICINLPIIYNIISSPFKLTKNKNLNFIIKKSYMLILVLTIIFIQSPIWLIVFIIFTGIYYRKIILFNIKKLVMLITLLLSLIIVFVNTNIDFSATFISRISKAAESFGSLEKLLQNEGSMAIRVIGYYIRIKVFLAHPVTGVGYRNTASNADNAFNSLDFYGAEKYRNNRKLVSANGTKREINGAILWNALSDTGIVGAILFFTFLIGCIIKLNAIYKKLPYSLEKLFISGLKNTYIFIIIFSVYDIRSNFIYLWFLYGLTLSVIDYYKNFIIAGCNNNILPAKI